MLGTVVPGSSALKVSHGEQLDGKGALWLVTVTNSRGKFIGKGTHHEAWYWDAGREVHVTEGFKVVELCVSPFQNPVGPCVLNQVGYGDLWFAVATTSWGRIPGKATTGPNRCWYTYGNKEIMVMENFQYLCSEVS